MLRNSGVVPVDSEASSDEEGSDEWEGIPDPPNLELLDHEEEYIDEDRYTTVTVESVAVSRDGLEKPPKAVEEGEDDDEEGEDKTENQAKDDAKTAQPKKRKKKFRYESRIERQLTETKRKIKGKSKRP